MNSKQIGNFKYLDNLVHSGKREIALDSDIILDEDEIEEYSIGIKLDLDDLTIDGNGHTIDACGKGRIFACIGQDITIRNITLKNGYGVNGGAIYNKGSLEIANSNFKENEANNDGGAIYNYLGNIIINDATLTNNTASNGGAIYNANGTINIIESTLQNNSANIGGAIYNRYNTVKIAKSSIENNHANNIGGAIYTTYNATLTVTKNVTLTNNTAENKGGAIYNDMSGTVNIDAAILANNSANL
jgi:predicted outer membrane repeat protein